MINKNLFFPQTAERLGSPSRNIQVLCGESRSPDMVKKGNRCVSSDDESKPANVRIKSGKQEKAAAKIKRRNIVSNSSANSKSRCVSASRA